MKNTKENLTIINDTDIKIEKALLVLVRLKKRRSKKIQPKNNYYHKESGNNFREDVEELRDLAISAGADVIEILSHNQNEINLKYFISSGKLEELKSVIDAKELNILIFDNELTATQQGNLEDRLKIKVIDRTALILDIFAQRAQSREGKLQVELAQLNYLLPRLRGMGIQLSRLGGGIGTRGPGEQKLEVDRRKIRKRISQLESKIEQISVQRKTQRKNRQTRNIFMVSLVGYTNSGKSTLLNTMTKSDVFVKDMLFSTLDSTTRRLRIPEMDEILLTDTVGFIEKLPHQLIMAFKSTLEEVQISDLLLIIIDSSNIEFEQHIKSVTGVLKEIEVTNKPAIVVFNKIDKLDDAELKILKAKYRNYIFISAIKKQGLDKLYERIRNIMDRSMIKIQLKIPFTDNSTIAFVFEKYKILSKKYLDGFIVLSVNADNLLYTKLSKYVYKEISDGKRGKGRAAS